jgi:hypothetical protein
VDIHFRCHTCRNMLAAETNDIGADFNCPGCDSVVVVPYLFSAMLPPQVVEDEFLEFPGWQRSWWGFCASLEFILIGKLFYRGQDLQGFLANMRTARVAARRLAHWQQAHFAAARDFVASLPCPDD